MPVINSSTASINIAVARTAINVVVGDSEKTSVSAPITPATDNVWQYRLYASFCLAFE